VCCSPYALTPLTTSPHIHTHLLLHPRAQEHLEKNTEHLAELTEAPLEKMERSEVVNFTRVTMTFLRNLLQGVEDGLTTGGTGAKGSK
jgi:hypothetical protein